MSDGKEVKRWEPCLKDSPAGTYVTTKETKRVRNVYVTIEDHDRVVAELRAEVERLNAAFESKCLYLNEATNIFLDNTETIARQERVIEKLREQRNAWKMYTDGYKDEMSVEEMDAELAAIEKEGGEG